MYVLKAALSLWNRSILPALALSVILTVAFVLQFRTLVENEDWLDHTDRAIGQALLLQKLMLDAETGVRGFLLSGEDVTFNPFREQAAVFEETLKDAIQLVADNPEQVARLNKIAETFGQWVKQAKNLETTAATEAKTYFGVGEGRRLMDICRRQIDAFLSTEQSLRTSRAGRLRLEIPRAILSGAAITLLLRILGTLIFRKLKARG